MFHSPSEAHDPFCDSFYLYSAKVPHLQHQLSEYNLALSVTVTVTDETQVVWTQIRDQLYSYLDRHGLYLEQYPTSHITPGDHKYTEEGYQFTVPGNT